jgi:hypothetical protein
VLIGVVPTETHWAVMPLLLSPLVLAPVILSLQADEVAAVEPLDVAAWSLLAIARRLQLPAALLLLGAVALPQS